MDSAIREILMKLRAELVRIYGARLIRVVLFGSYARGDNRPGSDIDVMVVLKGPVDLGGEIQRTSQIVGDLSLFYDVVISRKFVDEDRFEHAKHPLLVNVRQEGLLV
jgi:uncharacterized protein